MEAKLKMPHVICHISNEICGSKFAKSEYWCMDGTHKILHHTQQTYIQITGLDMTTFPLKDALCTL